MRAWWAPLALLWACLWACQPSEPIPVADDVGRLAPRADGRVMAEEAGLDEGLDLGAPDALADAAEVDAQATADASGDAGPLEALSLNSVVPNRGEIGGGLSVRIVGAGFTAQTAFFLGERACEVVEITSPNHARCRTPAQGAGLVDLRVVDGASDRVFVLPEAFTYFEGLSVTRIAPPRGRVEGGVPILIEGAGLIEGTEARIGGRRLLEVSYTDGGLMGALPPGEFGPQDVRVMNPNGAVIVADGFFYYEPLRLAAARPSASPVEGGGIIRLEGEGLTGEALITLGGVPCPILTADEARRWVEIRAPAHPAGVVDITAASEDGQARLDGGFLYYEPGAGLALVGVVPARGSTLGGEAALIGGAGFAEGAVVTFDDRVLACQPPQAHWIECQTPPHAPGPARVGVELGGRRVELEAGFTYIDALRLTAITPRAVAISGGALLIVEGRGFGPGVEVYLDDAPLTDLQIIDETRLIGRAPPHAAGAVDARITRAEATAVIEGGVLYFDPASRYGGLWGEPIDGAVNVTVRDADGGDPIEAAAVLALSADGRFELEGLSDARGQLTLSALGLDGPLSLTAAHEGYQVTTVEGVEVENITVYLQMNEGDAGAPPGGALLSALSGTLSGLDRLPKPRQEGRINVAVVETTHTNPYNRGKLPDPGPEALLTEDGPFAIQARAGELALIATAGEVDRAHKAAYLAGEISWGAFRARITPLAMGLRRFISASPGLALSGLHVEVDHPTDYDLLIDLDNPPRGADPGPAYYAVLPRLDLGAEGYWELDTDAFSLTPNLVMARTPRLEGWDPDISLYLIGFAFSATSDNRPYAVSVTHVRDLAAGVFISPFVGTAQIITPSGVLGPGRRVEWRVDEGYSGPIRPPSAYLIEISEPTLGPPKPLWRYIAPADQTALVLPALPRAAGATGLGQGAMILEVIPFLLDGDFDFDRFSYSDLNQLRWRAWAETKILFMQ
ncbi:IPT/TIG domain-containing protein [Myxococcota bacterium]|nr:IPT/TIG domain-containing protein [Myxococcota bacterium]MBU1898601.1 IPT/TIG domain-containing protein [Myxococcota bacterium]